MKIETQPRDDHQVSMVVELDSDSLETYKRKAAKKISKETKISGFRPGKAPYDVVVRHYGDKVIENQAIEDLLEDIYPLALKEANIDPSGSGQLEEPISIDPPKFTFIVPLQPEIELCDYHSIHKEYHVDPVTEQQVNNVLRRIQVNNAIAEPVEDRPVEIGDLVSITINANRTNPEENETAELVKGQTLQVIVEEVNTLEEDPWPYPEFSRELIGLNANEEKKVLYTYPDDSVYENLRNQEVEFTFTVQNIKALDLPEINMDFISTLGNFESVEQFMKNIRDSLETGNRQEYEQGYLEELVSSIVEQSTVKYPPHLLEEEIKNVLKNYENNLSRQNLDLDMYLKTLKTDKEKFTENQIKPIAENQLKRSLVLQEIIKKEEISFKKEELQSAVAQTLSGMDINKTKRSLPRGVTNNDMLNAATYEMANRLLSRNLMRRLKAISSGEPEFSDEVNDKTEQESDENSTNGDDNIISNEISIQTTSSTEVLEENNSDKSEE